MQMQYCHARRFLACYYQLVTAEVQALWLCRHEELGNGDRIWDVVRDRLVAPMLLLGSNFKLAEILDEPDFVDFIQEEYKQVRVQLAKDKSAVATVPPGLSAEDSAWSSGTRAEESNEVTAEERGERGLKRTRKVSF